MASSSTPQTSSAQIIIRSPAFMQIFKDMGKKGIQKLDENGPMLKDVTKSICDVAGQAPLVGICVQALGMIIQTAAAYTEIDDKAKKVIEYAQFLEKSMKIIADAGGDDEYLKENCLALLCAEAYEFDNENSRKQSWAKCMCGFICAQCKAKGLDDLANRLSEMNHKLTLHYSTVILQQHPTPSNAPLGDPSIKLKAPEELLTFIRQPGIRVLAVCGMGGIGKTTLLTTLYDQEFPKGAKQVKAFVEVGMLPTNIKEIQSKILQELENKNETFTSTHQGQNALRHCLQRLKEHGFSMCLCVDNVWKVKDLKGLLPQDVYQHLPESSCIMLSTRSHEVAKEFRDICCPPNASSNAYKLFEPNLLDIHEAEQLFIQCARIQDKDKEKDLLKEIVPLCDGLPLAINIYGTYFRRLERRKESEWRKVKQRIEKATESPSTADEDDTVLQTLEPSIDAQIDVVQDAFIDAALFWLGKPVDMARCALYVGDEDILEVLLDESIFSSKNDILECHDHFWAIARKRANLKGWKYVSISKMLVSKQEEIVEEEEEGELFTSGHLAASLRTHEVIRAIVSQHTLEFQILQDYLSIKYLTCKNVLTSGTCNISQGKTHDLKALCLHQDVNLSLFQYFPKLQMIIVGDGDFKKSFFKEEDEEDEDEEEIQVHQLPSSFFKTFSNLYFVHIYGDENKLDMLPDSFGHLVHLLHLSLLNFSCLKVLPDFHKPLKDLKLLNLSGCAQLARLPDTLGPLPALGSLDLDNCAQLARLPDTLGPLPALRKLDLHWCAQLALLPDTLGPLPALESLNLFGCAQLARLPDTLGPLPALRELDLRRCAQLASLPDTLGPLPALAFLDILRCAQLARLPGTLGPLPALRYLYLDGCAQLASLPDTLGPLPALESLVLHGCTQLARLPDTLGPLPALRSLGLQGCAQLARLPDTLGPLPALRSLDLHGCAQLARLPDTLGPLPALEYLGLHGCAQLARLPDTLGPLPALRSLHLHGCAQLARLPDTLGPLTALESLDLHGCAELRRLPDTLGPLRALRTLDLSDYAQLPGPLPTLKELRRPPA